MVNISSLMDRGTNYLRDYANIVGKGAYAVSKGAEEFYWNHEKTINTVAFIYLLPQIIALGIAGSLVGCTPQKPKTDSETAMLNNLLATNSVTPTRNPAPITTFNTAQQDYYDIALPATQNITYSTAPALCGDPAGTENNYYSTSTDPLGLGLFDLSNTTRIRHGHLCPSNLASWITTNSNGYTESLDTNPMANNINSITYDLDNSHIRVYHQTPASIATNPILLPSADGNLVFRVNASGTVATIPISYLMKRTWDPTAPASISFQWQAGNNQLQEVGNNYAQATALLTTPYSRQYLITGVPDGSGNVPVYKQYTSRPTQAQLSADLSAIANENPTTPNAYGGSTFYLYYAENITVQGNNVVVPSTSIPIYVGSKQ